MSADVISVEEARRLVALVCRRLALLHLAFAEVLVGRLGSEEGRKMVARAVKEYSRRIGEDKREAAEKKSMPLAPESFFALSDLPDIGMHERIEEVEVKGERRVRAYGCVMGRLWNEYGKSELGRLYCLVDPASSMTFNPDHKWIHTKALPDGDPFCELVMRPTTERDREEFASDDTDWRVIEDRE